MNSQKSVTKFFRVFALLFLVVLCLTPFFSGVYTFADALRGFEILHQFDSGAPFNTLNYPSVSDAQVSVFVSWWSPGQWFIPWLIQKATGISNLQILQALLIFAFLPISFFGYYRLFRLFDFQRFTLWASLAVLISSPLFFWKSLMFYGGDLFLLAFVPCFVIFIYNLKERGNVFSLFLLFTLAAFGLFIKTTVGLILLASLCYLFFRNQTNIRKRSLNLLPYLLTVLSTILLFKITLLSGETPSSANDPEGWQGVSNTLANDLFISLGSPLGIFTGASSWIQKFDSRLGIITVIINLALLFSTWYVLFKIRMHNRSYYELLFFFALPFFAAFIPFYLMDKAVSYEMRHFAPIAFLFFPAIVQIIQVHFKTIFTSVFALGLISLNLLLYFKNVKDLNDTEVRIGIKVDQEDLHLVDDLLAWDQRISNGVFIIEDYWFPSYFVRNNDKWVWNFKENQCVTGVELDHPPVIQTPDDQSNSMKSYRAKFIVDLKDNQSDIFKFVSPKNTANFVNTNKFSWQK